LYAFKFINCSI